MGDVPGARTVTVGLIVSGVGVLAYMQSNLTALLVEGAIGQALRRRRMQKDIDSAERTTSSSPAPAARASTSSRS